MSATPTQGEILTIKEGSATFLNDSASVVIPMGTAVVVGTHDFTIVAADDGSQSHGEDAIGITNKPIPINASTNPVNDWEAVTCFGGCKALAGAAITAAFQWCKTNSAGAVIPAASTGDICVGYSLGKADSGALVPFFFQKGHVIA